MILQGKNLVISRSVPTPVLAASKSCDVWVDAKTIDVAPRTNAQWEECLFERKSWQVTTNHLVQTPVDPDFWAQATSSAGDSGSSVTVSTPKGTATSSMKGLIIFSIAENASPAYVTHVDTYGTSQDDYESRCEYFRQTLISIAGSQDYPHLVIVSNYEYGLTTDLIEAIEDSLGVASGVLTAGRFTNKCLIIISGKMMQLGSAYTIQTTATTADTGKMLMNGGKVMSEQVLKDCIDLVGQTVTLNMELNLPGIRTTKVSGSAVVKTLRVTGTVGNLLQGSFSFKGTGPLT